MKHFRIFTLCLLCIFTLVQPVPASAEDNDLTTLNSLITDGTNLVDQKKTATSDAYLWIEKVKNFNTKYSTSFVYSNINSVANNASSYSDISTFNDANKILGFLTELKDEIQEKTILTNTELVTEGNRIINSEITASSDAYYWCVNVKKYNLEHANSSQYSNINSRVDNALSYSDIKTFNDASKIIAYLTILQSEDMETTHNDLLLSYIKAPTCSESGMATYKCTRCFATYNKEVPKNGHTVVIDEEEAATCTETGKTEGKHCSICGTVLVAQEDIPAKGHSWYECETTKSAKCTTEGQIIYECERCGQTKVETIPATGHSFSDWTVTKKATVLSKGTASRFCEKCDLEETSTIDKVTPTIYLSKNKVSIKVKKTTKVSVTGLAKGDKVVSWKSSNKKIATVKDGKIKGKHKGKCTVTVKLLSGLSKKIKVTVK